MADTLNIFGTEYSNVAGIIATTPNETDLTYIRPQGTKSITSNGTGIDVSAYATADVSVPTGTARTSADLNVSGATVTAPAGLYASSASATVASGSATPASSISATGATVSTGTNTLTLSKSVSNTPQVSAGYISSGTAGNSSVSLTASVTTQAAQTIYPSASDQTITGSKYLTGTQTIKGVTTTNLTADNIKSGVTVQIGDSADSDRVASVTGTYSGGGTSSKNVQIVQNNSTRITATSYTKACGTITVAKSGTYDIYWDAYRTSTSGTWGTQWYKNGTAQGTAQTTFTNSYYQAIHLTNITLAADDTIDVYGRSRGNSYYLYVGTLIIKEV